MKQVIENLLTANSKMAEALQLMKKTIDLNTEVCTTKIKELERDLESLKQKINKDNE